MKTALASLLSLILILTTLPGRANSVSRHTFSHGISVGELRQREDSLGLSYYDFRRQIARAYRWKHRLQIGGEIAFRLPGKRRRAQRAHVVRVARVAKSRPQLRLNLQRFSFVVPALPKLVTPEPVTPLVDISTLGPPPEPSPLARLNLSVPALETSTELPETHVVPKRGRHSVDGSSTTLNEEMALVHSLSMVADCNASTSAAFQTCITNAALGDTILLAASTTFANAGSFSFPDKGAGTAYITVKSDGAIPAIVGSIFASYVNGNYTRITPADVVTMPKLLATGNQPVLTFLANSHHWRFEGLHITNDASVQYNVFVNTPGTGVHHIIFDRLFVHPAEEVGTMANITNRSAENAFIMSGTDLTWTHVAIQGFTGYSLDGSYRLNANSILFGYCANVLIEDSLLEASGQLFFQGNGGAPANHQATGTSNTFTSATLSNTTDLDVGDLFTVRSQGYGDNHLQPNPGNPNEMISVSGYNANARITSVNHGTGQVTFTPLTGGFTYRMNIVRKWGQTGTYTLTWMGQTTTAIAHDASFATIRAALEALSNVEPDDFSLTTTDYGDYLVMFDRNQAGVRGGQWAYPTPVTQMTLNAGGMSGGTRAAECHGFQAESYTPLENPPSGTPSDIPSSGALYQWEGLVTDNVIVRRNIFAQHHEWMTASGSVKGFAEMKGGTNMTFDGNIFARRPTTLIFTPRNQGGASPWIETSFITITNNLFEEAGYNIAMGLKDGNYEANDSHDFIISNNLFLWPGGFFDLINPWISLYNGYNISITHNTVFAPQDIVTRVGSAPTTNVNYSNNIFWFGRIAFPCFDVSGCLVPAGTNNLAVVRLSNFLETFSGSWFEAVAADVGFTRTNADLDVTGDWTLQAGSLYKAGNARDATDGKDLGWIKSEMVTAMGHDPFPPSNIPLVNAGADQSLATGTTSASLVGTATDPNDLSMTHLWTRTSGPNTPTIVSATALSTSVTGMIDGTYVFTLTSTNTNSDIGSDAIQVVIGAMTAPNAPSLLTATAVSPTQINLSWTDNTTPPNNETGFQVERCTGVTCSNFVLLTSPAADVVIYLDTPVAVSTSYVYRVRAVNSVGNSAYSNTASATTSVSNTFLLCKWANVACVSQEPAMLSWTFAPQEPTPWVVCQDCEDP